MIFVTVGASGRPFDRLIERMDEISSSLRVEVVMQIGTSKEPSRASFFRYCGREDFLTYLREADLVVTHAGSTIMDCLILGAPLVVAPRLKIHDEALDDHQLLLCQELAGEMDLCYLTELEGLESAVASQIGRKGMPGRT